MPEAIAPVRHVPHSGMPPLELTGPVLSFFEFWPQKVFYAPMVLYWLWLSAKYRGLTLPTAANPSFRLGGWIGESKHAVLSLAGERARPFFARHICFLKSSAPPDEIARAALLQAKASAIGFPMVAKPDKGCRGVGVRRVRNEAELSAYISGFPIGEQIILQEFVDYEAEAGVFYVRKPGERFGRIVSLTLKYFPYVYGDGCSTLAELIARDPRAGALKETYFPRHSGRLNLVLPPGEPYRIAFAGSHSRGAIFRDGSRHITGAMERAFDTIAKDIPGFHFGRFDVRFSSIRHLELGEGFRILECNGVGAEATHIWDHKTSLVKAYRTLMRQYALMWEIGAENARRGSRSANLADLWRAWREEVALWSRYPATE
jgi:hypothetical protein